MATMASRLWSAGICGDHRRVISGRHLSKHDTDRETYMTRTRRQQMIGVAICRLPLKGGTLS
jgi:hypothetical protein